MFCRGQPRCWRRVSLLRASSSRGGQAFSVTPLRSSIPGPRRAKEGPPEHRNRRNRAKGDKAADCLMSCRRVFRRYRQARVRRLPSNPPLRRLDRKSRNRDRRKRSRFGGHFGGPQPPLTAKLEHRSLMHCKNVVFSSLLQAAFYGAPAMPEKRSSNRASRAKG
jgi:hypothetical protein